MKKAAQRKRAFACFRGSNGYLQVLLPEFDVKHVDQASLGRIMALERKPSTQRIFLEDGCSGRVILTKGDGELAPVAYALDDEAAGFLRGIGALQVGLRAFPIPDRRTSAQDRRTKSLMALRCELGLPERRISQERREPGDEPHPETKTGPWPYFG